MSEQHKQLETLTPVSSFYYIAMMIVKKCWRDAFF